MVCELQSTRCMTDQAQKHPTLLRLLHCGMSWSLIVQSGSMVVIIYDGAQLP